MRVFILCTGRTGSTTFIRACQHIINYSAKHESRSEKTGKNRLNFKDNHIEADNRLSWFLGQMDKKFGNDAFYVHLIRNREKTIKSLNRRWKFRTSIVKAFSEGVLKTPIELLNEEKKKAICGDYYDCVNSNIRFFLVNKEKKMEINLENIKDDFTLFWNKIGAKGNLQHALNEFEKKYNESQKNIQIIDIYKLRLFILRILNFIKRS